MMHPVVFLKHRKLVDIGGMKAYMHNDKHQYHSKNDIPCFDGSGWNDFIHANCFLSFKYQYRLNNSNGTNHTKMSEANNAFDSFGNKDLNMPMANASTILIVTK